MFLGVPTFITIVAISLLGGVAFASLAYLTARHAASALAVAGDPTKLKINDNFEISTGNAVVGLFLMSVIVVTGVPAAYMYFNNSRDDAPVKFELTHLQPSLPVLQISSRDFGSAQLAKFDIYRSSNTQHFQITPTPEYATLAVDARYSWDNKEFIVTIDDDKEYHVPIQGISALLNDKITLKRALLKGTPLQSSVVLSRPGDITRSELAQPDPSSVPRT